LSIAHRAFDLAPGSAAEIEGRLQHDGGPLEMEVQLAGPPGGSVWLTDARIVASDL